MRCSTLKPYIQVDNKFLPPQEFMWYISFFMLILLFHIFHWQFSAYPHLFGMSVFIVFRISSEVRVHEMYLYLFVFCKY